VAVELARQGLPTFPCGPDKRPLVRWKEAATADIEAVRALWRQHPGALVGLPCGQRSGLFVLDLDVCPETGERIGEQSLAALGLSHLLTDSAQPNVRTPSGGLHLLFAHPGEGFKNSVGRLGPWLDVRTEGGFIVAPGTVAPAGTYAPETPIDWHALPPLPEALKEALAAPQRPEEPPRHAGNGARHGWGQAALTGELARLLAAPTGERNMTWNRSALRLAQAAAAGMLDGAEAQTRLRAAALNIGLESGAANATIASGWAAGSASPRGPEPRHGMNGAGHGAAGGKEAAPEEPTPLLREIAPGAPFPVESLGPLRAAVEAVAGATQARLAIPAASALAVASLAVQGFADVETLGGPRPTPLSLLTVAKSAERKTSCDRPCWRRFARISGIRPRSTAPPSQPGRTRMRSGPASAAAA
jgi:hypothetical protein